MTVSCGVWSYDFFAVCVPRANSRVKLVSKSKAKNARFGSMWTKIVFWTVTWSQICNIRENTDLPSEGDNSWANCKYKKFKVISFQILLLLFPSLTNAFINCRTHNSPDFVSKCIFYHFIVFRLKIWIRLNA